MSKQCRVCMTELADDAFFCPNCGSSAQSGSFQIPESSVQISRNGGGARGFCRIFFSAVFCVILLGSIMANTLLGGFRYSFCDGRLGAFLEKSGFYDLMDSMEKSGRFDSAGLAGYLYNNLDEHIFRLYGLSQADLRDLLEENVVGGEINGNASDMLRQVLLMRENAGATFIFVALIVFNVLIAACLFLFNYRKIRLGFLYCGCPLAVNGILFVFLGLSPVGQIVVAAGLYGPLADVSIYIFTKFARLCLICGAGYLVVGIVFLILFGVMKNRQSKMKTLH